MAETKTVSVRVPLEELSVLAEHGIAPGEVMREALRAKVRALRARSWEERVRPRGWKLPKGSPTSEEMLREDRDSR